MSVLIPVAVIAGLALLFGLGLTLAAKAFHVKTDERIAKVRDALPGANCGACGFSSCEGYAASIVESGAGITSCPVGGAAVAGMLAEIMGVEAAPAGGYKARVLCRGIWDVVKTKYRYAGIQDCASAASLLGGMSSCIYGCVGLGSCATVCQFGAITVANGLAVIDHEKCTGCGACVEKCPKGIIKMLPEQLKHLVLCSNHERGQVSRQNCALSCIGCGLCVKKCPEQAIVMDNLLAVIDPNKCTNCGTCFDVCPRHTIKRPMA
jgi:Na+-translocating ferredoxin:NAD+ oxidoreductase RNF subunit RnfB